MTTPSRVFVRSTRVWHLSSAGSRLAAEARAGNARCGRRPPGGYWNHLGVISDADLHAFRVCADCVKAAGS